MQSMNKSTGFSASEEVINLLVQINREGSESSPRGLKVRELELATLELNPNFPIIDFEARAFNWKYFMGELAWYLLRDTNIDYINQFSNFWKGIANDAGHINSNYGHILFGEQIQWAYNALKKDSNTRQAICFVNQPRYQYEGNKDFVCTMYLNFWIRDNKLNMKVQMRSNDIFYGLTYDAPFFAFVQQTMWHWLKDTYPTLEIGKYYHCTDNIHYYEKHFPIAEKILSENPTRNPYWFHLREPLFRVGNGNMLPTIPGIRFMESVSQLLNSGEPITQESCKEILSNYFYIQ